MTHEALNRARTIFRYVVPTRAAAYSLLGWHLIGMTESPHDGQACAIMEWTRGGGPTEPGGEQFELREPTVGLFRGDG